MFCSIPELSTIALGKAVPLCRDASAWIEVALGADVASGCTVGVVIESALNAGTVLCAGTASPANTALFVKFRAGADFVPSALEALHRTLPARWEVPLSLSVTYPAAVVPAAAPVVVPAAGNLAFVVKTDSCTALWVSILSDEYDSKEVSVTGTGG